jgi:hypothetical protein
MLNTEGECNCHFKLTETVGHGEIKLAYCPLHAAAPLLLALLVRCSAYLMQHRVNSEAEDLKQEITALVKRLHPQSTEATKQK